MEIGSRIKQLRNKNGLTLEELASRTELTKGYLSQVERDLMMPSLLTLADIVAALGLTMAKFFQEEKAEPIVFTADDYFSDQQAGQTIHWIVPNAQNNEMEPLILELASQQCSFIVSPFEGEELGYVIAGRIVLVNGEEEITLKKGETFYLKGQQEHYLRNDHQQVAKVLWVMTPPNF